MKGRVTGFPRYKRVRQGESGRGGRVGEHGPGAVRSNARALDRNGRARDSAEV